MTGLDWMAGEINLWRPSAKLLRAALYLVLRLSGARLSIEQAGAMNPRSPRIWRALEDAWIASMPEPEPENAEPGEPLTWLKTWAIARQSLGLSDEEWLSMTPRMLQALSRQRLEAMRWQELMTGVITANAANYSPCAPKRAFHPREFMLHPWPLPEPKPVSGEDIMAACAGIPKTKAA